ncbi:hypothetical protein QRD43_20395 [Pelomonas sp. APW6]|uniref:Uncharacterized protein n=1 Tax=Roseateles subflavus TaxID=3053353 RepID=A0ABT7LN23_9BURK|nr:hypothetical protein [Pelomonas sp. APW6]MDL5034273.1 hypothetical protein [Pelomonas sp. APW6]
MTTLLDQDLAPHQATARATRPQSQGRQSSWHDVRSVDVYSRHNQPVAVVVWRGDSSEPFMALKRNDDGRLIHVSPDDLPTHDKLESYASPHVVLTTHSQEVVRNFSLYREHEEVPFLHVEGPAHPVHQHLFNKRSSGIFANDFRDRDGLPVGDTFGASLRAFVHGRDARDWPLARTAQWIATYSSDEMANLMGRPPLDDDAFDAYVASEQYQLIERVAVMEAFLLRAARRLHALDAEQSASINADAALPDVKQKAWAFLYDQFGTSTADLRKFFSETADFRDQSPQERERLAAVAIALVDSARDVTKIEQAEQLSTIHTSFDEDEDIIEDRPQG